MKINKILKYSMVLSVAIGISGCGIVSEDESIKHNGVGYGTVKSPYTGRIWLDRNLGAKHKCKSSSDYLCFGDYYQYGRRADGHEKVVFDKNGQVLSKSETTNKEFVYINKTNSKFFIEDENTYNHDWTIAGDWLTSGPTGKQDSKGAFWGRTDGSSICPKNFRVATGSEFTDELYEMDSQEAENSEDLYKSFLKIPSAGRRENGRRNDNDFDMHGKMVAIGKHASLWTLGGDNVSRDPVCSSSPEPSIGFPVRCIMDEDIQEDMEDEREKERR